jgi:hypothetical protein
MALGTAALGERTLAAYPNEFSKFSGSGHPSLPLIRATAPIEYPIYNPLKGFGFDHHTVGHSRGEYAREDGDGFHEIHVNTQAGNVAEAIAQPQRLGFVVKNGAY